MTLLKHLLLVFLQNKRESDFMTLYFDYILDEIPWQNSAFKLLCNKSERDKKVYFSLKSTGDIFFIPSIIRKLTKNIMDIHHVRQKKIINK